MTAFSRQHYETIAASIKHEADGWHASRGGTAYHDDEIDGSLRALRELTHSFVATFHMDSPDRFDEVRFVTACGFPPPERGED